MTTIDIYEIYTAKWRVPPALFASLVLLTSAAKDKEKEKKPIKY